MTKNRFAIAVSALVLMPVVAVAILALTNSFRVRELQVFGQVPPFEMTERSGRKVDRSAMLGKVWVASFVFTHCAGQCPLLCERLKKVQNKLRFKDKFRLVSFTMDPVRDTPQVLADYAKRFDADPYKWLFLTGEQKQMHALVQNGFRLASGGPGGEAAEGVTHSEKFVLVDANGQIRGYYDGNEDAAVKTLISDAKNLIRKTF